jgi:UDP-N-acetylmuramate--alanine ligase
MFDSLSRHRFHLVGAGGAGMSALGRLLHGAGCEVSGSDATDGPVLAALQREGLAVWAGHQPERIRGENGYVVRSAAVPADDVEVAACERVGFTSLLYAEMVGRLSEGRRTLAIAGTHGKTTTTALTVGALRAAGLDPSHLIGGDVPMFGGNGHGGRDDFLVVEACEFNRSFHRLRPYAAAILNVDRDHFDCYPSTEALVEAFAAYAHRVRPGGTVLVEETVPDRVVHAAAPAVEVVRVGAGLFADLRAIDVKDDVGRFSFVPVFRGRQLPRVRLQLCGHHNVGNALFALGLALVAGADAEAACAGIAAFGGVLRRFELRQGPHGGSLINDYAHHPAEIRAVIHAARRRFPGARLLVAFQPHQHERTWNLLDDFAQALAMADQCVVADIYGARESVEMRQRISSADLVRATVARGGVAECGGSVRELPGALRNLRRDGDMILILGAGDIDHVVEDVVATL